MIIKKQHSFQVSLVPEPSSVQIVKTLSKQFCLTFSAYQRKDYFLFNFERFRKNRNKCLLKWKLFILANNWKLRHGNLERVTNYCTKDITWKIKFKIFWSCLDWQRKTGATDGIQFHSIKQLYDRINQACNLKLELFIFRNELMLTRLIIESGDTESLSGSSICLQNKTLQKILFFLNVLAL